MPKVRRGEARRADKDVRSTDEMRLLPFQIPSNVLDQFKMTGKVVAISGAGAGIGFAVAEAMAEAGANVAILYNSNKEAIQKAADLAQRTGTKVQAYQCGVTSYDAVESTISTIVKDFGRLDVFVANSGVAYSGPLIDEPIEEWKRVVDVNYNGVAYCAKAAGKVFRDQGKGNMIITASMSGSIVNLNPQAGYNSSKAAVIHLARSLAQEWAPFARVRM